MKTYEEFKEAWQELSTSDKVNMHNDYCREHTYDDEIYDFTEDFFNEMFSSSYDAARALYFGDVKNWGAPYIRFNGYANLVSMEDWDAEEFCEMFLGDIYDCPEIWGEYIDGSEDDEEENEDKEND